MFEGFKVLFIEDDPPVRASLVQTLELSGLAVQAFGTAEAALPHITAGAPVIVITDVRLPGMDGLSLLERVTAIDAGIPVVVVTAHGDIAMAVRAMRSGAYDFIEKPFAPERFVETAIRALDKRVLRVALDDLREQLAQRSGIEAVLLGQSAAMQEVRRMILRLAATSADVMIEGETGTGKELLARACHLASPRGQSPLMALNCAGLPESMAETELFGYGPGAFEGARAEGKLGLLELTAGGTLFLDGVGEMSPRLQVKLLRFLQDGCFRRVGSDEEVYLDVRVICATQVDLSELCASGEFRQDLYHRLNVLSLHIPPLRECLDGLTPLVEHFLDQASRQIGCPLPKLAPAAMERLSHYHWPGNVRQLENVLFQAVSLCEGGTVKAEHIRLPDYGVRQPLGDFSLDGGLDEIVGRFEKAVLERLYSEHSSSRSLGKRLGVSHTTIANKLREYEIGKLER